MKETIKLTLDKAKECLADSDALLAANRPNAALSRAYYAMFHSAQAILLSENIKAFTHQGVNIQFNKYFIKTGIFPKQITTEYNKILDQRLKSDYEIGFKSSLEDARNAYFKAFEFYNIIENHINKSV